MNLAQGGATGQWLWYTLLAGKSVTTVLTCRLPRASGFVMYELIAYR